MNTDQQTRFEIMQALEKDFPDRLLEELIDVALYVEVGGVERARLKESAEKFFETLRHLNPPTPAQDKTSPRVWGCFDDVPYETPFGVDGINGCLRKKGARIEVSYQKTKWQNCDLMHSDMQGYAPFTEVLS